MMPLFLGLALASPAPSASPVATPCTRPDADATVVTRAEPVWPWDAAIKNESGTVKVKVTIDASGAIVAASIYRSTGFHDLDVAAIAAAKKSTFAPEIVNCRPIPGSILLESTFPSP